MHLYEDHDADNHDHDENNDYADVGIKICSEFLQGIHVSKNRRSADVAILDKYLHFQPSSSFLTCVCTLERFSSGVGCKELFTILLFTHTHTSEFNIPGRET